MSLCRVLPKSLSLVLIKLFGSSVSNKCTTHTDVATIRPQANHLKPDVTREGCF